MAPGDDILGDVGTSVWMLGGIGGRVLVLFGKGVVIWGIGDPKESTTELLELGNGEKLLCGMPRGGPRCFSQRLRSDYSWPGLDARFQQWGQSMHAPWTGRGVARAGESDCELWWGTRGELVNLLDYCRRYEYEDNLQYKHLFKQWN